MNWFTDILTGNSTAHTVFVLSAVLSTGVLLGLIKVRGIGFGAAGVLFAGILFSHFHLTVADEIIEFVREFGLILFVFTIGMQVGPSFFASMRKEGLKLNLLAAAIVLLGVLVAAIIHFIAKVPVEVMVGLLSGAVTNIPGLGAAQQVLKEHLPALADAGESSGLGCAVTYPFGIFGVIIAMLLTRFIFRIVPQKEAEAADMAVRPPAAKPKNFNLKVTNQRLANLQVRDLASLVKADFVISRLLRGNDVMLPEADTRLQPGDILHVVCTQENADKLAIIVGDISKVDVREIPSELVSRSILLTRKDAVGKTVRELDLMDRHGVAITRIDRAGIELVAKAGMSLCFGDRLTVVGGEENIRHVVAELGDSMKQLRHPNILPIFVGIIIGVLVGSIPIAVPGMPAPVKLGLAGGPLLVAILLSRYARIGPIVWYLPQSANLIVREIGITLFLACVGLKSGGRFVETLMHGPGLYWIFLGAIITLVPVLIVAIASRAFFKLNYFTICGLLAGATTNPPALAFADTSTSSDAPSVTFASVYALTMFLRILTAQVLVLFLA